ncbi:MAG TPA: ABC transporter substrate-binding protein [Candidatus Limnocylindrales bacterium]|nr:ABC transporter substrate-binding protein [Candidatus Limnocylindrales bacterium]
MRVVALAAALLLAACASAPQVYTPTPVPTHEPGTLVVSALLDLSGSRAPSGQPQRDAMQLWIDQTQVGPLRVRVKFVDVASSDARLLLELRRATVEDRVDAIVVGAPVALDEPFMQAVQVASIPVLLTLPSPEPTSGPGGRFTFALAPTPQSIARVLTDDLVTRSLLQPTLVAGDETTTAVGERASLSAEMRRRGLMFPTPVSLVLPDGPQRVRSASVFAKSIVLAGASAAYGDIIRSIPVTADAPRVYLSYLTETADVTNLRDQTVIVTWPGSRALAASTTSAPTTLQRGFIQRFTDRHGAPSTLAGAAYDALALIEAAAVGTGSIDAEQLRLRLENTRFAGVVTQYTFTPARHVGFASDDLVFLKWSAERSAPVIAP